MQRLVIKCTWGADRPEACIQALTVAATGLASGAAVSLWLTGDAVKLVVAGGDEVDIPHSPKSSELLHTILAGAAVTACTQCLARRDLTEDDLVAGVRIAGSASFVEDAMAPHTTALVY